MDTDAEHRKNVKASRQGGGFSSWQSHAAVCSGFAGFAVKELKISCHDYEILQFWCVYAYTKKIYMCIYIHINAEAYIYIYICMHKYISLLR